MIPLNRLLAKVGIAGVCQEHNLPIMIVLFNNYGYHSQKSGVPRFFPDGFAVSPRRVAAWSQGGGQIALIDIRLAKAAEKNGRPDRAN